MALYSFSSIKNATEPNMVGSVSPNKYHLIPGLLTQRLTAFFPRIHSSVIDAKSPAVVTHECPEFTDAQPGDIVHANQNCGADRKRLVAQLANHRWR